MKKILSLFIVLFSFIFCCSVNAQTEMIPLQESENYKGMSIIPANVQNTSLIMNYTLELQNNNSVSLSYNISGNMYIIVCGVYKETLNNVQNILTLKNNRNLSYIIENYDYSSNNNNLTINNNLTYFCCVKCENMSNNNVIINYNNNMMFYDSEIDNNYKYVLNTIIYIPDVENAYISFNSTTTNNYIYGCLTNYIWLYQYEGIYSYYNCNGFSFPYNILFNTNGYNGVLRSTYILQGSGKILDLQPTLSTFPYGTGTYYSMYNLNYLYGYLTTSDNKSFTNNINGYVDLYYFGNNGQYSGILQGNNNIYYYDDVNSAISSQYFNINFNYFAYCYSFISVDYHGGNIIFNNLSVNNSNEKYLYSYFKDNGEYYTQDVGETNNTDLASELGINKINCDWWNLKGQLNNLIYYIITGVPFINKIYSFNSTILGPLSLGFTTFLTFSPILLSIIGLVCAVKIFFKMLD